MRTFRPWLAAASLAGLVLASARAWPAEAKERRPGGEARAAAGPAAEDEPVLRPGERIIAPSKDGRFLPPRVDEEKPAQAPTAKEGQGGSGSAGEASGGSPGAAPATPATGEAPDAGGAKGGYKPAAEDEAPRPKGETVYVGPRVERAQTEEERPQVETQPEPEDEERSDGAESERDEEIEALREQIGELQKQLEEQPGDASRVQELERRLCQLEREARLIEQARLERVAGYANLVHRLQDVQRFLSDGEWQVLETVSWAEWLLQVYGEEATRLGALAELEGISQALQGLRTVRERLANEDLFYARFELTRVIVAIDLARSAAMVETGPASGAVVDEPVQAPPPSSLP